MKAKIARRNYKLSDGTLVQVSDSLVISGTRDLTDFATYGWDTARLDAIEDLRDEFDDLPTDEELMGAMVVATGQKNEKGEELRVMIREMRSRVENKYGEGADETVAYGWELLSKMDDNDLRRCGKRVWRLATADAANLATEGVTAAVLTALITTTNDFDDLIDTQITRIKERDVAVTGRINKGNELYAELVKLANTGKTHWESRDESKYNDYVINESSSSNQVATGAINGGAIVNISVTVDAATDQITITHEGTGATGSIMAYFATMPTDGPNGYQQTITAGTPLTMQASALGFDATTRTRLNLYNPNGGAPIPYRVEIL